MTNCELLENLLKQYSLYKSRIVFLDKQQKSLSKEIYEHIYNETEEIVYTKKVKEMSEELSRLRYLMNTIEESIFMVNEIDKRYKTIIQKYYIYNVRMEDIAELLHLSRSRCYELFKESLQAMSKIMFGNAS